MNLYFRFVWLLCWRIHHGQRIDFLDTSRISYRALPSDCDINLHLTNSRYAAFMDLARTQMMAEMGILKRFLTLKWIPVINAAEFTYIRDIRHLEKFDVLSKIVGWDEKYLYIEQRFVSDRCLHCIAHIRAVFVCKGKQIAPETLLKEIGFQQPHPELPPEIIQWKGLLQLKKHRNT